MAYLYKKYLSGVKMTASSNEILLIEIEVVAYD